MIKPHVALLLDEQGDGRLPGIYRRRQVGSKLVQRCSVVVVGYLQKARYAIDNSQYCPRTPKIATGAHGVRLGPASVHFVTQTV